MRISLLTLGMVVTLLLGSAAFADDAPDEPTSSPHRLYLGAGVFNNSVDANAEWVTDKWGNVAFTLAKNSNQQWLSHVNWRTPLGDGVTGHDSGYYVGAFAGQLMPQTIDDRMFRLWGVGADIGYHWVNENTRKIASVGLGTTQKVSYAGTFVHSVPVLFFSFSIALGQD